MNVIELLGQTPQLKEWSSSLYSDQQILVTGLAGSAKVLSIASLFKEKRQSCLIIAPNLYHATNIADDMAHIVSDDEFYLFPVNDVMSAEMAIASPDAMSDRIEFITALQENRTAIYIVPLSGIRKFLPSPKIWHSFSKSIALGDEIDLDELVEHLILMGYTREKMVEKPGEFSLRGSILDVYPLTLPYPVRIDFFDIEVDSIRYFDFASQRSIENLEDVTLTPVTDSFNSSENLIKAAQKMEQVLKKHLNETHSKDENNELEAYFSEIIESWEKGQLTDTTRYYPDYLYPEKYTLFDYFPKDGLVFIDDYSRIQEAEQELLREEAEWMTVKLEEKQLFEEQVMGEDFRELLKRIKQPTTFFSLFQKGMGNLKFQSVHQFIYRSMQQFFGQMPLFKVETARWQKNKCTVILLVPNEERAVKLEEMLIDFDIPRVLTQSDEIIEQQIQIVEGELQSGFELLAEKLVVITEREIFNVSTKKRAKKRTLSNAERLKDYTELQPGDFVVHANHGIGKYIGMETLLVDGIHQDYLSILYQKDDKLFIPVTQLNLIQKYMPSETKSPKVNKLGGSEWTKTKSKVSSKIEDIADELLELYAKRESEKGFAFSPDDMLQKAFEDAFPYPETEDQIRSVAEIKHDMEKIRPMDRLLVGDVGFGKTEVALRAAFKAVQDNKQVALLVPTTILAQQHYDTMTARFEDFPVSVGLLSRFRTKKQQEETIQGLRKGEIDIVVGTHRVLSKDIEFQDLGLLIIDEEQRFGVKHKERLKSLRFQVDVLTLTATPIPRTLHMSMLGIRDLSVIETPPANRYPIQTYVMEKNPGAIREAIERELARNGQVFYLYNRIDTIHQKADELQFLVPDARIAIAHGRLTEIQLENILFEFIHGDYDILVTTTIIETGVDIPNANTLFVEDADHMGLSQLYQLRGRVGRTNRVAYAYFMYAPQKVLNEVSEKRLQAIKDFTELGAGFKIAMRDLSIRGAGSMLGAQQHGFIDSVGFDMYAQMLSDAIARKRGVEKVQKTNTEINLGLDAYIPSTYIEDERQKIEIYKRIRQFESIEMYEEVKEDLFDRFGEYPTEVENLLYVGIIKMYADASLVESILKKHRRIVLTMSKMANQVYETMQLFKAISTAKKEYKLDIQTVHEKFEITLMLPASVPTDIWLDELLNLVQGLHQQKYESAKQESEAKV